MIIAENRARYDLEIYRGASYLKDIWIKIDGELLDLTDFIAKAQIRPSENSQVLTSELTCTIYANEGRIRLSLTSAETAEIDKGIYHWDFKLTDNFGYVFYWIYGQVFVDGRVTE